MVYDKLVHQLINENNEHVYKIVRGSTGYNNTTYNPRVTDVEANTMEDALYKFMLIDPSGGGSGDTTKVLFKSIADDLTYSADGNIAAPEQFHEFWSLLYLLYTHTMI